MVTEAMIVPVCHIKVNGSNISTAVMGQVEEVIVEQSLHLPDMCTIRLVDANDAMAYLTVVDGQDFAVGKEIEIKMGGAADPGQAAPQAVFKGEITSVELELTREQIPYVLVRGYARSHRLHRGRHARTFMNMTDSDIVSQLAGDAGMNANVEATTITHDYILQNNQTNWEFLRERAARVGYELYADDRTLHFRKPKTDAGATSTLTYGQNLLNVRVTMSTAYQANEVKVRGWEWKSKQAIVGTATSGSLAPETGIGQPGGQVAESAFSSATKVAVVNRPVASQDEAKKLAEAIYNEFDGAFVTAEGTCMGNSAIKVGKRIELEGIGHRFSGQYYVTSATHTYGLRDGYLTTFVVSGRQTNSVLEMTQARGDGGVAPHVVIGIVTNNTDPDGLGRVKVRFPWLSEDQESWWARISSPMGGKDRGFYWLPEIEDEVLVAFEHGDINRPYILGGLWNGLDNPPKPNDQVANGDGVNQRMIKTRIGHVIVLDDTNAKGNISIKTNAGHHVILDDTDGQENISIIDKTGNNSIKIETPSNKISVTADGDINLTAKGKVNVDATQDVNVTTKANANVDVTGNATITTKGNTSVDATGMLDVKGATVTVQAQSNMTLKANAMMNIEGGTGVNISGLVIKLN